MSATVAIVSMLTVMVQITSYKGISVIGVVVVPACALHLSAFSTGRRRQVALPVVTLVLARTDARSEAEGRSGFSHCLRIYNQHSELLEAA